MQPEKPYHIYNHANGAENLFKEAENNRFFLRQWEKHIQPIANALACCLMPNHFHFLIKIRGEPALETTFGKFETFQKLEYHLSKQFSNFFSSYTQAFNKKYHRKGSLFSPNFKRKEITSQAYISRLIAYIHLNPVHHGFTGNLGQWPFFSYSAFLEQKKTLLDLDYALQWFGGRDVFIEFHYNYLTRTGELEEGIMLG
jgi:REP element-mobilizing transposase RayT